LFPPKKGNKKKKKRIEEEGEEGGQARASRMLVLHVLPVPLSVASLYILARRNKRKGKVAFAIIAVLAVVSHL